MLKASPSKENATPDTIELPAPHKTKDLTEEEVLAALLEPNNRATIQLADFKETLTNIEAILDAVHASTEEDTVHATTEDTVRPPNDS